MKGGAKAKGITEWDMLSQGFQADMLADLVEAELATVTAETVMAGAYIGELDGGLMIKVNRLTITDAGRSGLTAYWEATTKADQAKADAALAATVDGEFAKKMAELQAAVDEALRK